LAADRIPGLTELLARWESVRGAVKDGASYYALPGQRREFPSTQVDTWVKKRFFLETRKILFHQQSFLGASFF
jgi:hypothetical protein